MCYLQKKSSQSVTSKQQKETIPQGKDNQKVQNSDIENKETVSSNTNTTQTPSKKEISLIQENNNVETPLKDNLVQDLGTTDQKQSRDLKISLGSFVQKRDNIDEYLSHFEAKVRVGKGHYAEVYKLENKEKGIKRAMKVMKKNKIPLNEKQIFLREIQILKKLDHPNILKLFEFLEDESSYYLITELCQGVELFDIITEETEETMTEKDVATIIQQIFQALAYAHSNKIMHRDIKPENIIVSLDPLHKYALKVIDWGIGSDFASNDPSLNMKCGTPYYAAPEVIKKKYNEKCDIWSTGVILYTLLAQEIPFNGDSTTDILLNVLKGHYSISGGQWDKVSDDAKDLVKKTLCIDIEKRLSAEEALKHPWFKEAHLQKVNENSIKLNLTKLQQYKAQSQLQKAAMSFIVSHLINDKEKEQYSHIFKLLDENGDGKLSKNEIMNGYQKAMGSAISLDEVNSLFDKIDVDQSGFIDYTEFITAAIDSSVFTEIENLRQSFKLFDKNGDGFITSNEIQSVLGIGLDIDKETWKKVVEEVDQNGDGQISFEEFQQIMETLAQENSIKSIKPTTTNNSNNNDNTNQEKKEDS